MADKNNKWEIIDVPLEQMKPGSNVRQDPHESELLGLGESLKAWQHHPVILDPEYFLLDGWRRWLAARLVGLKTLKAIITGRPLSESDLKVAQIEMSVHRAGLTGWELYQACYELLQLNPGWLAKDLAARLKLDPSYITRALSPSKTIPDVRAALKAGKIGLAAVYAISKEPEEKQAPLLELKMSGASRDELEEHRRNGIARATAVRVERMKFSVGSGVTITLVGHGLALDLAIDSMLAGVKALKKGRADGLDAKSFQAAMASKAKAASDGLEAD